MYQILIKKSTKPLYMPYVEDDDIWETDDVEELETKYKALLADYPSGQLKAIHDLTTEIEISIEPCI